MNLKWVTTSLCLFATLLGSVPSANAAEVYFTGRSAQAVLNQLAELQPEVGSIEYFVSQPDRPAMANFEGKVSISCTSEYMDTCENDPCKAPPMCRIVLAP